MSTRAIKLLRDPRIVGVISDIEAGEPVDYRKVAALQALDFARMGQLFLLDRLEAEEEADRQIEELMNQAVNGGPP